MSDRQANNINLHSFIEGLVDLFHDATLVLQNPGLHLEEQLNTYKLEMVFNGMLLHILQHANPLFSQMEHSKQHELAQLVSDEIISWSTSSYQYSVEQADETFGDLVHYIRFTVWDDFGVPFNEEKVIQSFQEQGTLPTLLHIYGMLLEADIRMRPDLQENTPFSLQAALQSAALFLLDTCDPSDSLWELDSDEIAAVVSRCSIFLEHWFQTQAWHASFLTEEAAESQQLFIQLRTKTIPFVHLIQETFFIHNT